MATGFADSAEVISAIDALAKEKKILHLTKNDSCSNHCKVKWLRGVVKIEAVIE